MRQSIRALGWTITLSMLILFAFLVTAVYSVYQTVLVGEGLKFGEFQSSISNNNLVLSMPVMVNNTGYYDITECNTTVTLKDYNGTRLVANSTFIQEIQKGSTAASLLNLSLSLDDIISKMTYLLFNDTELKMDRSVGFRYAYALAFHLNVMNTSMPWGAPLYGITMKEDKPPSFNGTHLTLDVFLELENHSFFDIDGTLYLEAYNEANVYLGSERRIVNIPSNSGFSEIIKVPIPIENPSNYTGKGNIEVYFELPTYDYTFRLGSVSYG